MKDQFLSVADLAYLLEESAEKVTAQLLKLDPQWKSRSSVAPQLARKLLTLKSFRMPQKVISFQMLKGGVAKTTSALNLGWRAAQYGARVLFLDLDQQANLTFALGVEAEDLPVWVDVLERKAVVKEVIVPIAPGVDLIPSSLNNSVLDRVLLHSNRNWATAVKGPLREVLPSYDLVIIDTAPSLSAINTAVTCASDMVILPISPDKFSMIGVKKHLEDLEELKGEFDLDFEKRILFTRFDGRESSSQIYLNQSIELFEDMLLKHYIRSSTELKNAIGGPRSIFSTKNNAREDYDGLTREILGFWKEG
ncbi:MAG: ParA family protein [Bdellovibrio sp.]|nr:MAG: ParA family protein [Bdellovibrio sp.]